MQVQLILKNMFIVSRVNYSDSDFKGQKVLGQRHANNVPTDFI